MYMRKIKYEITPLKKKKIYLLEQKTMQYWKFK